MLSADIIGDLLTVTKGETFEDLRDHAVIRLLLTGMRRDEVTRLRVEDIDLQARQLVTVGLKGKAGRPVAFGHKTALALVRWLRVRASNRYAPSADSGPLWLAVRNRAALTGNGIYQMLRRRTEQAGHPRGSVRPHLFRHTRAHQHLADGGSEGTLMQSIGWSDRSMIDRYGASLAQSRALADAHQRGLDDRY